MNQREHIFRVLKAQSGDRDALDGLFQSFQARLFRCIRQIVGSVEEAEDVLQDVFVILQKHLIFLKSPELFQAWAYRIASREAMRHLKKTRKISAEYVDSEPDTFSNQIEIDPLNNVLREQIGELIVTLPPASRSVLVLHYTEDFTMPEVAEILGIPLGTAKSRLAYGLNSLRQKIGLN